MFGFLLICSLFPTILCYECKGNGYFRDPSDCAKMIRCSNGKITHRFSCSEGKVFNDITKSCDDPKYVNCHNSVTDTTFTTSPSSVTTEDNNYGTLTTTSSIYEMMTTSNANPSDMTTEKSESMPNSSTELFSTESPLHLQKSFVDLNENNESISFNKSFVIYEENLLIPINESFVIYEAEEDKVTTTSTPTEETMDSMTVSTLTPTPIESNVSPVLESILRNETIMETTVTESTDMLETSTKSDTNCPLDDNPTGLTVISSNYSTKEISKLKDNYKIVCYFTNWSRHRSESAHFTPNHINPFLCTHIIYAFAVLDNQTLTMRSSDECTDIENKYYQKITSLREINPKLKVLIALGGWADSVGDKYSRLVSNQTNRLNFIENVIQFIKRHDFDGLDLDWEYPRCWQSDCGMGPATDKLNFAKLIRELRLAFNKQPKHLLLTGAVGAAKNIVDNAYDFNALMVNLDFINLMTYDFHTSGSVVAGHHSPLFPHPNAIDISDSLLNANFSVNHWIRKGVPSHKIILGIPFYGRTFRLLDSEVNDFGAAVNGTGSEGVYTKEKGFLSYYEICINIIRNDWTKRVDTYLLKGKPIITGPYAYKGDQWVGYDDRDHIIQKTDFIKDNALGGAMVWALDLDDFNGHCCRTKNPLLKTINKELREYNFDLKFFCP